MKLPLFENRYEGYSESDFDWSVAKVIGTDNAGRRWWFVGDKQNPDVFYSIYPIENDEWAIFEDYWTDEWGYDIDSIYLLAQEDAEASDYWNGES